jgi:glycosyltransferase involved in cell wall biosynthesis
MLRVLHVDSGRVYRGGQNQVRLLVRELAREPDVEQRLVTKRGSELGRRVAAAGVIVSGTAWFLGLDPRGASRLTRAVLEFRPHILHAHDSHALGLAVGALGGIELLAPWLALWPASALFPTLHRQSRDYARPLVVATRRVVASVRRSRTWRQADRVIAISEAVKAALVADGIAAADIALVPSGIDPDEVRREAAAFPPWDMRGRLGLPWNAALAVNVAALDEGKDQRTLVRAAASARARRPDLHWVVAGAGPERRRLEAECRALGVADRVHLIGHVERPEALLREAHVCVMTSREEGLGTVVLQALALGRPVVATRAGGLPEMVPEEWLVPVGDAAALADHVVQALEHVTPMPLPARFTAGAMARGVLAVYRSLV